MAALLFLIFSPDRPKQAEAALKYSAAPGFNPGELTSALEELRKDQGFLTEIATRSGLAETSDPDLAKLVTKLGGRLTFEASHREPIVFIRFAHPKVTTAIDVANATAEIAKERLESQQRKLAMDIICKEDEVADKRKLLELSSRPKAPRKDDYPGCGDIILSHADCKANHDEALRDLDALRAQSVFSIGSIRVAREVKK